MSILQLFNLMLALYLCSAAIALAFSGIGRLGARIAAAGGLPCYCRRRSFLRRSCCSTVCRCCSAR